MSTYSNASVPIGFTAYKEANKVHQEMKLVLKRMDAESLSLLLIKDFCNDHMWIQSDSEYHNLILACRFKENFSSFMESREILMMDTKIALASELDTSRTELLSEYAAVFKEVNEITLSKTELPPDITGFLSHLNPVKDLDSDTVNDTPHYIPGYSLKKRIVAIETFNSLTQVLYKKQLCLNEGALYNPGLTANLPLFKAMLEVETCLSSWMSAKISSLNFQLVSTTYRGMLDSPERLEMDSVTVGQYLLGLLHNFHEVHLPALKRLANPAYTKEHIDVITKKMQLDISFPQMTTSGLISKLGEKFHEYIPDAIKDLEESAVKEYRLSQKVTQMASRYHDMKLDLEPNCRFSISVLKPLNLLISTVESDLLTTVTTLSAAGNVPYAAELCSLESQLRIASNSLRLWEVMQPLMITVLTFFESDEVRRQLNPELRAFKVLVK